MLSEESAATVRATLPVVGASLDRSPRASTRRCSPTTPSCSTGCSTAATRPAASSAGRWPGPSPPSPSALLERPGRAPRRAAGPDRPQARLAGHHRRPVRDRAQAPVRRHRRGARRRGHPRGRRRLGRGLLADGRRPDRHGGAAVRTRRRRPTATSGGRGRSSSGARRPPTSSPSCCAPPTAARCRRLPGRPVRLRPGAAARRRPPDPPVQPVRRPGATGAADHRQAGARRGRRAPTARCPTSCTRTSGRATS